MKKNSTIKIKNTVPHLLAALWHHPDCPKWLQDEIWDSFNDRMRVKYTPTYWKSQLEAATDPSMRELARRRAEAISDGGVQ